VAQAAGAGICARGPASFGALAFKPFLVDLRAKSLRVTAPTKDTPRVLPEALDSDVGDRKVIRYLDQFILMSLNCAECSERLNVLCIVHLLVI